MSSLVVMRRGLVAVRVAPRQFAGVGLVERLAKLAPIDFRLGSDEGLDLLRVVVPALQVPAAELALGIFLVTGALLVLADFDLRRCFGRCRSCRSCFGHL